MSDETPVFSPADLFIQWKGTDLCGDFRCYGCGMRTHIDADFAYFIECNVCHRVYEMPSVVALREVTRAEAEAVNGCIQMTTGATSSPAGEPRLAPREIVYQTELR